MARVGLGHLVKRARVRVRVRNRVRVRVTDLAIWLMHSFSNSYSMRHACLGLG